MTIPLAVFASPVMPVAVAVEVSVDGVRVIVESSTGSKAINSKPLSVA